MKKILSRLIALFSAIEWELGAGVKKSW